MLLTSVVSFLHRIGSRLDIERFEPYESAWRLPYVGQKPLRLKHFLLWQALTFALMSHFSISTNIKKVIL